ncbi:LysR family transcriptional regulator [Thalassorhabdomicrobium marinisediminis]|uniref:LysR family transcriptional regulator n=1 Tax=Thalassorhabdomicrobium marinisediminis TaxID=2170577 RepID=UPI002492D10D|nr:LysR family transcriptional regulator [Thalassorhabdomicrobium marinisediminis]
MHSNFLKYFDEVARQGSIRKAASILNVSSTTVNRKILDVESQLGTPLFDRTPEGVALTSVGTILLEHCRKTLYDFERAKIMMDDLRDMRTGHLQLSTIDSVAYGILPDALRQFSRKFPDISFSVTTAQPDVIMQSVAAGEIDVAISFLMDLHPDVRVVNEKSAPFGIILRPDHPLAGRPNVRLVDVAGNRFVRTTDARGGNSYLDHRVANVANKLKTHVYSNNLFVAKEMILAGHGVGIYTKIGFLDEIRAGKLCFVPLLEDGLSDIRVATLVSASSGLGPVKHHICKVIGDLLTDLRLDA